MQLSTLGRVDALDLYYQYGVDPNVPIEDVAGAVKALIQRARWPVSDRRSGSVIASALAVPYFASESFTFT